MCVVAVADKEPLTPEMVELMYRANSHGCGAAWRETDEETGEVKVKWSKGMMKLDEMKALVASLPLPYVAHFRISSVGPTTGSLCHPFPISADAPTMLSGETDGAVLFHNGTYGPWKSELKELAIKGGLKIPVGSWNDTRAMAWIAHHLGYGYLELVDEKVVVYGPESIRIFSNHWHMVGEEKGIWVSNKGWETPAIYHGGAGYHHHRPTEGTHRNFVTPPASLMGPTRTASGSTDTMIDGKVVFKDGEVVADGKAGGTSPQETFRTRTSTSSEGVAQQESTEESEATVRLASSGNQNSGDSGQEQSGLTQEQIDDLETLDWAKRLNPNPYKPNLAGVMRLAHLRNLAYGPH